MIHSTTNCFWINFHRNWKIITMSLLQVVKSILQNIIDQIDSGNCNMSDEEMFKTIDMLRQYANPEEKLSKDQVCSKLNVSRATFDNKVRAGKFPKGKKQRGFKELFWTNKDLASNC